MVEAEANSEDENITRHLIGRHNPSIFPSQPPYSRSVWGDAEVEILELRTSPKKKILIKCNSIHIFCPYQDWNSFSTGPYLPMFYSSFFIHLLQFLALITAHLECLSLNHSSPVPINSVMFEYMHVGTSTPQQLTSKRV